MTGIDDATDVLGVTADYSGGVAGTDYFTLDAPSDIEAGNAATYTVTRYDQYGNLNDVASTQLVYLYTSSGGGAAAFQDSTSGTTETIASGASSETFDYTDFSTITQITHKFIFHRCNLF